MHLKFKHLLEIAEKLRAECPWDKKQTLKSLLPHLIEECEEVKEAIESGKSEDIADEMGDVLFTMLLMAQIASETNDFDMGTILEASAAKMISRHSWVFGTDEASTPEEATELWLKNKAKEKK
ncbi:MAG: hypothetical protein ACI9QC_000927 [Oceanicoccus sp.]|jgi:uncharacterized protein YabN with tetrapyrrole methylase and pyrophosphatase domain